MTRSERYADFDQVSILDYVVVIWRSRAFLFTFCTISVLAALIFGLLSQQIFESSATLLPPTESNGGSGLPVAALMGRLQAVGLGTPSVTNKQDVLVSILESRTLSERIVDKYALAGYYVVDSRRKAVASLQDASEVSVSKAGLITVTVADRDPRMAAELANAHTAELNKLLRQMDVTENSQRRRFILDRLTDTESRLRLAEDALMRFQENNRAVSLQEQAEGVINVAAELKGKIMAAEVELQLARNFGTESNPRVIGLRQTIEELKKQLAQVQYGTGLDLPGVGELVGDVGNRYKEIHLAAANVPKLGLQFARLTRDLKIQDTVYTLLTQQLEEAKIDEARDVLGVQVLDPAIPAIKKSRPRIALNMVLAGVSSLMLGICFVFIGEYFNSHATGGRQPAE